MTELPPPRSRAPRKPKRELEFSSVCSSPAISTPTAILEYNRLSPIATTGNSGNSKAHRPYAKVAFLTLTFSMMVRMFLTGCNGGTGKARKASIGVVFLQKQHSHCTRRVADYSRGVYYSLWYRKATIAISQQLEQINRRVLFRHHELKFPGSTYLRWPQRIAGGRHAIDHKLSWSFSVTSR